MMATIQEAAKNAMAFARELLGDRAKDLRLEEVVTAEEDSMEVWRITLSMPDSNPMNNAVAIFSQRREYKTFTVVKSTGEVTSMTIREIANA